MKTPTNGNLSIIRRPKNKAVFNDSTNKWKLFRSLWLDQSGMYGDYAVINRLDLSGYVLNDFPAGYIAFTHCNLDNSSFKSTNFQFGTTFIQCSMRNIDLAETLAADALFVGCDLTGARISTKKPYTQWASEDMDGKDIPSIFVGCKIDAATEQWLIENKCIVSRADNQSDNNLVENVDDRLERIGTAPQLNI